MLRSLLKKKSSTRRLSPEDRLEQVWSRNDIQSKILKIKDILVENAADDLANDLCKRFLRLVWFLPASEGHHHAKEFGLFIHSMETAIEALNQFDKKIYFEYRGNKSDIDSFETRRKRPHAQYAHFVAGLLHDIGKVVMYSIVSEDKKASWSPSEEGLYDFVLRNPDVSFASVKHKEIEYYVHQKISPYFASTLLGRKDYEYIDAEDIGDILNAIGYKPYTENKFFSVVKADMVSTSEDVKAEMTKKDIIGELITALKDMFKTAQIPINSVGGRAWVYEQFTAITVAVVEEARHILASKDQRVPDIKVIWNMLKDRQIIDHEGWSCIYVMEMSDPVGRPVSYKVLKFRNNIFWGNDKRPETCVTKYNFSAAAAASPSAKKK